MKVVVCIKQVPDTKGGVEFNPDGTLNRAAMLAIMNPDDKAGLEAALRLKDQYGAEVTVVTMGLPKAEDVLREALAMGADNAILVTDRVLGGADTWATSQTLAGAIRNLDYDLIITGRQAIDGDTGQTAPSIAEHLGATRLTYVLSLKVEGDKVIAERQVEEGVEVIETKFPVLCTATKESNKPRYATVKGVMRSFNTEIGQITLADLPDADTTKMGLKGSPTKVKATFTPKRTANCVNIEGVSPVEIADNLIGKLVEAKVL